MALVQTKTTAKTTASSSSTSVWTSNTTTGNLIVVGINTDAGITGAVTSVTDSQSNTYTKITDIVEGGGAISATSLWYATNITGGTTPTITATLAGSYITGIIAREYSGFGALDKSASAKSATSGASLSSGATATLTGSNDLVIGFGGTGDSGNTYTAGSGYANAVTLKVGTTVDMGMEDKTLSGSTAAQTATFTVTNVSDWACHVATFQAASGAPAPNKSDTVTVTESVNVLIPTLYENVSDSTTVSESVSAKVPTLLPTNETVTTSESVTVTPVTVGATSVSSSDTVTTSESVAANFFFEGVTSDTVTTSESVALSIPNPQINVSDTVTTSEFNDMLVTKLYINVSDTITTSDIPSVFAKPLGATTVFQSETVSTSEYNEMLVRNIPSSVNDSVTVSESVGVVVNTNINKSDTVTTSDNISFYIPGYSINVNEFILTTDRATVNKQMGLGAITQINVTLEGASNSLTISSEPRSLTLTSNTPSLTIEGSSTSVILEE